MSKAQKRGRIAEGLFVIVTLFIVLFCPTAAKSESWLIWAIPGSFGLVDLWLLALVVSGWFNISLFKKLGIASRPGNKLF